MADYRLKSEAVQAVRWNRIGDPPGGRPLFRGDPRVVVPYKRDGIAETTLCVNCNQAMKEHGWLPAPPAPLSAAAVELRVDPFSGEHSKAVPPPTPIGYPKVFARSTRTPGKEPEDTRIVTGPEDEHEAMQHGFHFVSGTNVAGPPAAPDAYPQTFVKKAKRSEDPHNQAPDETRTVKSLSDEQKAESEGFTLFVEPDWTGSAAPNTAEPFPKRYAKKNETTGQWDHYEVEDAAAEKDALAKGYYLEHPDGAFAATALNPDATLAEELTDPHQKGEPQVSRAAVEPGYPRTLVKFSAPNRVVHNAGEQKQAEEAGYRSGVVICPGLFVVRRNSGQVEALNKHLFEANYARI